ncbi:MAG: hypothetical protein HGA31_00850 [Candidatus Moranbacteria bacterium]|nr:hypothetical protein [Candidatus Moranbacteria bacterium]
MRQRKFYIGDILNLLFYDVNDDRELFLDEDRSEGIDDLLAFMLGLGDDTEAREYFEDDFRYSCAIQVCIESLSCQFAHFTERKFRNQLRAFKKRVRRSFLCDELETSWLREQAKLYAAESSKTNTCQSGRKKGATDDPEALNDDDPTMLVVESIGYLYLPAGQERFDRVNSFNLFNDRPMNTN